MREESSLSGKVAVVTGGGGSIGRVIAHSLGASGATVVILDVRLSAAESVVREIEAKGGMAQALEADVTDAGQISEAFASVYARTGPIEILVNNAGILGDASITDISEAAWDKLLDVNLKGAFLCSREVASEMMARRWGRIINISSVGGKDGFPLAGVHYAASKAGMLGLTRQLAKQLAPFGVTVNAVAPVTTESEMIAHRSPDRIRWIVSQIPLGRLGRPEDTADAVAFLASEESGFITGETLDVCGGLYR